MKLCGYFLPLPKKRVNFRLMELNMFKDNISFSSALPFLHLTETDCTVSLFLEALERSALDDAKAYVSKNYVSRIDLDELSDFFCSADNYKSMGKVEFKKPPRNCITNSIIVAEGKNEKKTSIIHLHMIKEPDKFGEWKIYGIDKE